MSRLEAASADFEDIGTKVSKMEHMLVEIPIVEQIHAPEENVENVIELVAPVEHEEDTQHLCCRRDGHSRKSFLVDRRMYRKIKIFCIFPVV